MKIRNTIKKGIHQDNNPYDQPQNTMRDSVNGLITNVSGDNYRWTTIEGTTVDFSLLNGYEIMSWCILRERLFIAALDSTNFRIYELLTTSGTTLRSRYIALNSEVNMSTDHPIRSMIGYYESEYKQYIIFTDFNNQPRSINIAAQEGQDPTIYTVTYNSKFLDFAPALTNIGEFEYTDLVSGGNLLAGTYFIAWRLYNDVGYFTDWSMHANPVPIYTVGGKSTAGNYYIDNQGGAPDENTGMELQFKINNADSDYPNIQIAAFYSNDYNSAGNGVIFYDSGVESSYTFNGNENIDSIAISDLTAISTVIKKCKNLAIVKDRNTIANLEERAELDVSDLNIAGKNNQIDAEVDISYHKMFLDKTTVGGLRSPTAKLYPSFFYKVKSTPFSFSDSTGTHTPGLNEVFRVSGTGSLISGTCTQVYIKRKYSLPGATSEYDFDNLVYDELELETEYVDYKSSAVSHFLKGYPAGETAKLGLLLFDLTGRPYYVRWINNTYSSTDINGDVGIYKRTNSRRLVDVDDQQFSSVYDYAYNTLIANITGLEISNLNITGLEDKISGFSIVRAPIKRKYLAWGLLMQTTTKSKDSAGSSSTSVYGNQAIETWTKNESKKGIYQYFCPEDILNFKNFSLEGLELENQYNMIPIVTVVNIVDFNTKIGGYTLRNTSFYSHLYGECKMYIIDQTISGGTNDQQGISHDILQETKINAFDDNIIVDNDNPTSLFKAKCSELDITLATLLSPDCESYNLKSSILKLDINEAATISYEGKTMSDSKVRQNKFKQYSVGPPVVKDSIGSATICTVKNKLSSTPYGSNSDAELANQLYISTGHYQEINASVLADVESGGEYIFNNIDILGGDTFVGIWQFLRSLGDIDILSSSDITNTLCKIPIESRINLALRSGNIPYNENFYSSFKISTSTGNELEDYNYNDGYSSDTIDDHYLPVPYNLQNEVDFDTRARFSNPKSRGEIQDSFRVFQALNYIDLSSQYGQINNIREKFNKLIFWQPDAIGYIPIGERAIVPTALGEPTNLGVGGIYERHDEIIELLGNSNQFGLVESPIGFHWYDAKRKVFITLDNGMSLTQESLAKGLDSFLFENISQDMQFSDNPLTSNGVHGVYDEKFNTVFYTFKQPTNQYITLAFNVPLNIFTGRFNMKSNMYLPFQNSLWLVGSGNSDFNLLGSGNYNSFLGEDFNAYVELIINIEGNQAAIFDSFEFIGNDTKFVQLYLENSEQSGTFDFTGGEFSRLLKYRNKRWFGHFPKIDRQRLNDGYLKIRLIAPTGGTLKTEFLEIFTDIRKKY